MNMTFFLKNIKKDIEELNIEIEKKGIKTANNKEWIDKFMKNRNITSLSKKVIDELIEDIYIYENGNIDIKFKYNDVYNEAIDFVKKHNCDIIV